MVESIALISWLSRLAHARVINLRSLSRSFTHFTESFDDSFQALAEAGSCQILIDFYSAAGRQRRKAQASLSAGDPDGGLKRELRRFFRVKFSEVAS